MSTNMEEFVVVRKADLLKQEMKIDRLESKLNSVEMRLQQLESKHRRRIDITPISAPDKTFSHLSKYHEDLIRTPYPREELEYVSEETPRKKRSGYMMDSKRR